MRVKDILKLIPGVKILKTNLQFSREYNHDKKYYKRHYSNSSPLTKNKLSYIILLTAHSLEKGMSNKSPRRFGIQKTAELMDLVKKYESFGSYENDFAYMNAINILRGYVNFYKEKGWTDTDEYKNVSLFIKQRKGINKINAGSFILRKKDFEKDAKIDFAKFLASRHSVREFKKAKINESDFKKAVQIAALSPSACNRQMCKAYLISNELKNKRVIKIGQGFGGFEKDTINTIIVTFDVNANCSIGERNQGWFNAGLFSMNLVNAMHSLGIGSCFCQFSNSSKEEQSIKELLNIPVNERIAVIIACGYYVDECKIPYSPRKSVDDIYRKI